MSYATMLAVPVSGPMYELEEFRNAWGGAMRVWQSLYEKYFGGHFPICDDAATKKFWALTKDPRLSDCEWLALAFTYDKMICEVEHAPKLAAALREFDRALPATPGNVNHLQAIASALDAHSSQSKDDCVGFAFIQTSVAADAWYVSDVCTDIFHNSDEPEEYCPTCEHEQDDPTLYRMFDWSKDNERSDRYFFLFKEFSERPTMAAT